MATREEPVQGRMFEMDRRRFGTKLNLPMPGSHTRDLLVGLGYPRAAIDRHLQDGVIDTVPESSFKQDVGS
jgi:hypothetical protein